MIELLLLLADAVEEVPLPKPIKLTLWRGRCQ
jgi:hypothetical protein